MSGLVQIVGRYAGESQLSVSDPTSVFSGFRCNRSEVYASSATSFMRTQNLLVLRRRLNPQPIVASRAGLQSIKYVVSKEVVKA